MHFNLNIKMMSFFRSPIHFVCRRLYWSYSEETNVSKDFKIINLNLDHSNCDIFYFMLRFRKQKESQVVRFKNERYMVTFYKRSTLMEYRCFKTRDSRYRTHGVSCTTFGTHFTFMSTSNLMEWRKMFYFFVSVIKFF